MTLRSLAGRIRQRLDPASTRRRVELDDYEADLAERARLLHQDTVRLERYDRLKRSGLLDNPDDTALRFVTEYNPGSYYSGVPGERDLADAARRRTEQGDPAPGAIDLDAARQLAFLAEIAPGATDLDTGESGGSPRRYRSRNGAFDLGDATLLSAVVAWAGPERIIEVGSGWSTAALLDTLDAIGAERGGPDVEVTCIEPYPKLLEELVRPDDLDRLRLIDQSVQDVDLTTFDELEAGDILFLDTTHVVKPGSDVVHNLFHVLPRLAPGVVVHIHDIPWPFQTAAAWDREGRIWTECFMVGSFLQFNPRFEVLVFSSQLVKSAPERVQASVPAMVSAPGGSLWLRVTDS